MLQLDGVDHLDIEGVEEMHLCRTIQLMCDALGARCVANALYVHRYRIEQDAASVGGPRESG